MPSEFNDRLDAFHQLSQLRFFKILDSIIGQKDLVIDASVIKCMEKIGGMKILQSHNVQKVFKFSEKEISPENFSVIFLLRADLIKFKKACEQINSIIQKNKKDFHIILIPRVFYSLETLLEEEGLFGAVKLHSFCWEWFQLDTRLFSLELPELYKYTFVLKDTTHLSSAAKALWSAQHIFGKIPLSLFIGSNSKIVHSMVNVYNEERELPRMEVRDIGCLIVIDRDVDYPSVLLTPGTYTGLVADTVGINTGIVELTNTTKQSMLLTSEDETYNHIKHKHLTYVISHLRQKIKEFYSEQSKRHNMTVQEMREFVKNDLSKIANQGKILSNHLHLCEKVTEELGHLVEELLTCQSNILDGMSRKEAITFIEKAICTVKDPFLPLRLIALLVLCQGSLSSEESTALKMQFFHAFGHDHLLSFHKLQNMGLYSESSYSVTGKVAQVVSMKKTAFQITAQKLKLLPPVGKEGVSMTNPQDVSYVFGGLYLPVIVQFIELLLKKEKSLRDVGKMLPGGEGSEEMIVEGANLDAIPDINPKCVLVYFIGGITYAEVAALDFLEKKTGCRIVCVGTSVISGISWAESVIKNH